MSVDVHRSDMDMTGKIAEEIRALLGRLRMSGRDLARALDVSPSWVSYRLTGTQEIGVNDLARIAAALGVSFVDLLPDSVRRVAPTVWERASAGSAQPGHVAHPTHPIVAAMVPLPRQPVDRPWPARPVTPTSPSGPRYTAPTGR